jgi:hypothetical protein
VLDGAHSDSERAFAYGYLTHLAADTYSHNYFVPLQLIISFRARALKHVYWEARFDAMQPESDWKRVRDVVSKLYPDCDELMERVVERTLFSFRTNKRDLQLGDGVAPRRAVASHDAPSRNAVALRARGRRGGALRPSV